MSVGAVIACADRCPRAAAGQALRRERKSWATGPKGDGTGEPGPLHEAFAAPAPRSGGGAIAGLQGNAFNSEGVNERSRGCSAAARGAAEPVDVVRKRIKPRQGDRSHRSASRADGSDASVAPPGAAPKRAPHSTGSARCASLHPWLRCCAPPGRVGCDERLRQTPSTFRTAATTRSCRIPLVTTTPRLSRRVRPMEKSRSWPRTSVARPPAS